jgi:hypothetical protein
MSTTRERREARAERLREWAGKRETDAGATLNEISERYRGDHAFNTQPGHIPERARVMAREDRAFESLNKAASMASRAEGIEAQLKRAIYSDDPDATEALERRISELESKRERMKAINAAYRKRDVAKLAELGTLTLEAWDKEMETRYSFQRQPHPSYELQNLGGNIKRNRDRLAQLQREASPEYQEAPRLLNPVRYGGECRACGAAIERGGMALYFRKAGELACYPECSTP